MNHDERIKSKKILTLDEHVRLSLLLDRIGTKLSPTINQHNKTSTIHKKYLRMYENLQKFKSDLDDIIYYEYFRKVNNPNALLSVYYGHQTKQEKINNLNKTIQQKAEEAIK